MDIRLRFLTRQAQQAIRSRSQIYTALILNKTKDYDTFVELTDFQPIFIDVLLWFGYAHPTTSGLSLEWKSQINYRRLQLFTALRGSLYLASCRSR